MRCLTAPLDSEQVELSLEETANLMVNDQVDRVAEVKYVAAQDRMKDALGDKVSRQVRRRCVHMQQLCMGMGMCGCWVVV